MKPAALALLCLSLCAPALAQEVLRLADEDIARLGLVFAPVVPAGADAGPVFPATVVTPPDAIAAVSALHAGLLERWLVLPGQAVQAGEALAHIRSTEVLDLQSSYVDARSHLDAARFEADKDARLFEQGIIAAGRLQQTERALERAENALRNAAERLRRAGVQDPDAADAAADPGLYVLRAPAAGILTHRAVNAGAPVQPGMALASLSGAGRPWLAALVPARLAQRLEPGQALSLAGNDGSGLTLRQKDFEVDPATQTVEILAEFTDDVSYLPGQILRLRLPPPGEGMLVPAAAVVHSGDQTTVYLRRPEGVEARVLELLPAGADYLATSGLRPGEAVAVQGAALLKGMQLGLGGE